MTPGPDSRPPIARQAIACAVAVALLNLPLTMAHVWPTLWTRPAALLSIELAVLVLVLALAAGRVDPLRPGLRIALTALLLTLSLGRYGEVITAGLFGRPINLHWEARHLPRIFEMAYAAAGFWKFVVLGLIVLAVVTLAGLAIYLLLGLLGRGLRCAPVRRMTAGLSAAVAVLYAAGVPLFAPPVSANFVRQAGLWLEASSARAALPPAADPLPAADLRALGGRDVFVLFLESYGATVFEEPRHATPLAGRYAELAAQVASAGWNVATAYVIAPTFGGASWLSHASFLSGAGVSSPQLYEAFIADTPETLVDRFRGAGYRTVALVPGIKHEWPQGASLRFDRVYDAAALDYRGPAFGWWGIPDQFSLERLYQQEIARPGRKPLFVVFPTIMSHMPFTPTPPYQPDWAGLTTAQPYGPDVLADALVPDQEWAQIAGAFVRTIRYDLDVLGGFLAERAGRNAVVVALGDHQPPAIVTGPGRSWAAPVHIFTRDKALHERLLGKGFRSGLIPARPALGGMERLPGILLRAFDPKTAAAD
ncbi:MAG: sulfatase-like hydrolase/transferase [Alphaproteobacteria bacterium]|nr:sulfatase-like hydrolase/transferase [Alphaproteobacteria bacterium]